MFLHLTVTLTQNIFFQHSFFRAGYGTASKSAVPATLFFSAPRKVFFSCLLRWRRWVTKIKSPETWATFWGWEVGCKLLDDVFFFQTFIGRCERLWNGENCFAKFFVVLQRSPFFLLEVWWLMFSTSERDFETVLGCWPMIQMGSLLDFELVFRIPILAKWGQQPTLWQEFSREKMSGVWFFNKKWQASLLRKRLCFLGGWDEETTHDVGRLARFRPVWPAASNFLRTSDQTCDGWSSRSAPAFLLFGVRS